MSTLRAVFRSPVTHILLLTALLAAAFLRTNIVPVDDHFAYQRFIEALAAGRLDLSIPGFQGASFLALPLYLLIRSPLTNIHFQIGCALLLPLVGYAAAQGLLRDRFQAILCSYALTLMPFLSFVAFRGFTFPSFTLFVLLTLALRGRSSPLAFIPWGISVLIKPFSIALFPLFLLWKPTKKKEQWWRSGWVQCCLAALLPLAYVIAQKVQVGHLIIGSHPELSEGNVFVWTRFPLNVAHGIQMLLSIHNYYFPDPARTGPGNLSHTSPLLVVFGLFTLLYPRGFFRDRRLALSLGLSCGVAYALASSLDHMDHYYLELTVLCLVIASLPFVARYRLFLPLVLATLHFQFFYLYLLWRGTFFMDESLFLIPIGVDLLAFVTWVILVLPDTLGSLRSHRTVHSGKGRVASV